MRNHTLSRDKLTLGANLSSGTFGGQTYNNYVSRWYFNLDPNLDPEQLDFSVSALYPKTAPLPTKISHNPTQPNDYKADGDGKFDIEFLFPTSNNVDRFDGDESITYLITYDGTGDMWASSFYFLSETGGGEGIWYTAAHIQDLNDGDTCKCKNGGGSTWIGSPVPVPSTMLLLGSGLVGLVGFRRKFGS